MRAIRPVLLVGTGDFSELRAVLQAHRFGTIVAPSLDQARLMLRQFRVDAIITFINDADVVDRLAKFRTPLVVVGADPMRVGSVNCAAFVPRGLDVCSMPRLVARVIAGECGIFEVQGAA